MKNLILVLVSIFTLTFANAQNNGQANENPTVKIELAGWTTGNQAIVKVYNKQSCTVDIKLNATGFVTVNVPANSWVLVNVTPPANGKVQAKAQLGCNTQDLGQVELDLFASLPISSVSISATRVNASTFKLNLALGQVDGTNNIVIVKIRPNVTTEPQSIVVPIPDGLSNTTYVVNLTYTNKSWKVLKTAK